MVKLLPQDPVLQKFIDYYWVIDGTDPWVRSGEGIYDFPSLAPELILGLEGSLQIGLRGRRYTVQRSALFGYIDSGIEVYGGDLKRAVVIKFKSQGLASIMPFTAFGAPQITQAPLVTAQMFWGRASRTFDRHLTTLAPDQIGPELDQWLLHRFDTYKPGIITDLSEHLTPSTSVHDIIRLTQSSYSTLARHFKSDTGLTPKKYLTRKRFKHVIDELFRTKSTDWFHYIARYGYYDQTHFIKEIKRYSGFTPNQLLTLPRLIVHRPT